MLQHCWLCGTLHCKACGKQEDMLLLTRFLKHAPDSEEQGSQAQCPLQGKLASEVAQKEES